jgi:threonine dehydratase
MITLDDVDQAAALIGRTFAPTPQYAWPKLAQRAGCEVWVKHENHTPTGAFKVRGGLVYLDQFARRGDGAAGMITATRGNHGQSIAFASARAGIAATIYVPHGNSPDQNASMRGFGANVVEFGADFDEARVEAVRVGRERSLHYVPSFHHDLVRGVATGARELFGAVAQIDTLYVPIGMGSGICAAIAVRDLLGLATEVVGVVAETAPAMAQSFFAGRVVPSGSSRTFADGIATREPNAEAFEIIRRGAARIVQVSEDELAAAMRALYDDTHQVAEGAGAAATAALLQEAGRHRGRRVAVIMSGGNIERARLRTVLDGGTPSVA